MFLTFKDMVTGAFGIKAVILRKVILVSILLILKAI
ncbi:Variable outer membrane protein (plasmid) [Borrelia nietonii YOR]|uniref:Variable outer membrane protein n=2 Tax=Borrelia TaxID=138 RepID=W5SG84_9SPIR|nr:Variable outer membrane protein [Borrelia nietonii YOR]AHH14433.1 Variable outer membrane protein [Borrelia hermsii MTW]